MDTADYDWLVGSDAQAWLHRVASEPTITPRLLQRLRRDLSVERARLVVEQVELRRRARDKFQLADQLFFTRRSLEQATDDVLARVKAHRFPAGTFVVDICCGIGGDLMALAERGPVRGVDRDAQVVALARANLAVLQQQQQPPTSTIAALTARAVHGSTASPAGVSAAGISAAGISAAASESSVVVGEAESMEWGESWAWHVDPDRRSEEGRTTQVEWFQPPRDCLESWIAAGRAGGVKVAPATDWTGSSQLDTQATRPSLAATVVSQAGSAAALLAGIEREWLGSRGECRQQMIWTGAAAQHPGLRTVTVADRGAAARRLVERRESAPERARSLGAYLVEAHPAVLAARLTGSLALELGLREFPSVHGYLSADRFLTDPLISCYHVVELLPFDRRLVKQWLRARPIGTVTVKKRGVEVNPEQLAREWSGKGDEPATIVICRWLERTVAIACRRSP
jgi:hypothetical protein